MLRFPQLMKPALLLPALLLSMTCCLADTAPPKEPAAKPDATTMDVRAFLINTITGSRL